MAKCHGKYIRRCPRLESPVSARAEAPYAEIPVTAGSLTTGCSVGKRSNVRKKQLVYCAAGALLTAAALTGVARATPGAGVVGTIVARAGFADTVRGITFRIAGHHGGGTDVLQVRNAQDSVMQQIVFAAGGHTGWHSHPGPALVLVTEGELTLYSSDDPTCTGRTYTAGQAFIDPGQGHVHMGRASQTQSTVVWVTYFDVPPGSGVRIDVPDPGTCFF